MEFKRTTLPPNYKFLPIQTTSSLWSLSRIWFQVDIHQGLAHMAKKRGSYLEKGIFQINPQNPALMKVHAQLGY